MKPPLHNTTGSGSKIISAYLPPFSPCNQKMKLSIIIGIGEQRAEIHFKASVAQGVRSWQVLASWLHLLGRPQLCNVANTLGDRNSQLWVYKNTFLFFGFIVFVDDETKANHGVKNFVLANVMSSNWGAFLLEDDGELVRKWTSKSRRMQASYSVKKYHLPVLWQFISMGEIH